MTNNAPLWIPSAAHIANAQITHFCRAFAQSIGASFDDYESVQRASIVHNEDFWRMVWQWCDVRGTMGTRIVENADQMPGARYFPEARLNFAENLLKHADRLADTEAIVFWGEEHSKRTISWRELKRHTARAARALKTHGVKEGSIVASILPMIPEAAIGMLATTSLGAIWTSCSPDFGAQGILDRFAQVSPEVLIVPDGYVYNDKVIDLRDKIAEVARALPSLKAVIVVDYLGNADVTGLANGHAWTQWLGDEAPPELTYTSMPFNAPVYVLYSSGTTGKPKCLVHTIGGLLVQHAKEHMLHCDLRVGDRIMYFSTSGWMMWHWLHSALQCGATIVLFDGSPFAGRGRILWELAAAARVTHFGTSAKYIEALKKLGVVPRKDYDLSALRCVLSTGSPLSPECFDYVYQCVSDSVCLSSISGGTDIAACFAIGNPTLPVWRGELQCKPLGMATEFVNEQGKTVEGERGELICRVPFPSMPLGFLSDPDGARFHAAYFEKFPGAWTHGDFGEITIHNGIMIHGRSDATLNPGGVRIGTAELYRQLEDMAEINESIAIGQTWGDDTRIVLFVKLSEGVTLDDALREKIKSHIRATTTPRHVPAKIVAVDDIPKTKNGKLVELAVRAVVHGQSVPNADALLNPAALDHFRNRVELIS